MLISGVSSGLLLGERGVWRSMEIFLIGREGDQDEETQGEGRIHIQTLRHWTGLLQVKKAPLAALALGCSACSRFGAPDRPSVVPREAVYVTFATSGCWQVCRKSEGSGVRCTIWNGGSAVLQDESFVPLDGRALNTKIDLRLRTEGVCTGFIRSF